MPGDEIANAAHCGGCPSITCVPENDIGPAGVTALAEALKLNTTVTDILLYCKSILSAASSGYDVWFKLTRRLHA